MRVREGIEWGCGSGMFMMGYGERMRLCGRGLLLAASSEGWHLDGNSSACMVREKDGTLICAASLHAPS